MDFFLKTQYIPWHYQGSLLRPWPQKMAVFRGQRWHLDPPFTCADKDLCRYEATQPAHSQKLIFFIIHQNILPLTPSYCSWKKQLIWVFEWRKSVHYWWSHILFSPECKELTSMLDHLLYTWGVPPVVIRCVHWTMQMWVLQTWIKAQGLAIVMKYAYNLVVLCLFEDMISYGIRELYKRFMLFCTITEM